MRDIMIDDNGDILIQNSRMVVSYAKEQMVQHLILACPGEFKLHPLLGGKIRLAQNGMIDPFWIGDIKTQLRRCNIDAEVRTSLTDIEIEIKD